MSTRQPRSARSRAAFRIFIIGALAAALVVFVAAVLVRMLLPAAAAGDLFRRQAEARLGRAVRFQAAQFTGLNTLRLENLEVSAGATFAEGTLGAADAVLVRAKLFPMLAGRVGVTDAVLIRPRVTLERDARGAAHWLVSAATTAARPVDLDTLTVQAGTFAYVDLSSPTLSGTATDVNATFRRSDAAAPIGFTGNARVGWRGVFADVSGAGTWATGRNDVTLTRLSADIAPGTGLKVSGEVTHAGAADRQARVDIQWTGIDPSSFTAIATLPEGLAVRGETSGEFTLETSSFGYRARLTSDLSAGAVGWRDVVAKAAGTKLLVDTALIKDNGRFLLRDLAVTLASIDLHGDGEISSDGTLGRTASLRLRTADFDIEDFFAHLKLDMPDGLHLSGPVSAVVSIDGWTGGGDVVADVDGAKLDAAFKSTFRKPPGAPLRLLASGRYATPLAVDLSSLRLDFGGLRLSGRGSYTPGKVRPTYTFRMKTNAFPLSAAAELTPMIRPYAPTGDGVLSLRVTRGEDGPSMSGELTLVSAGATLGGAALTRMSGTARFTDDALSAPSITGRLDGSPLHLDLRAHRYGERPFIEADVAVEDVNLARVLQPTPGGGTRTAFDTHGVLRAGHVQHPAFAADDTTLEWNLANLSADPADWSGTVTWRQGPGRLGAADDLVSLSTAARLAFLPAVILQGVGEGTGGALDVRAFRNADFEALDEDLSFAGGKVTMGFVLQAGGRRGDVRGAVSGAGRGPLTGALTARVGADQLGGPAGAVLGRRGVAPRLILSGTAETPVYRLDPKALDAAGRSVLRQAAQGAPENGEDGSPEARSRRDAFLTDLLGATAR